MNLQAQSSRHAAFVQVLRKPQTVHVAPTLTVASNILETCMHAAGDDTYVEILHSLDNGGQYACALQGIDNRWRLASSFCWQ